MMIFAFYKHTEKRDIHDEPDNAKSIRIHTIKYKFTKHTDNKAKKDWDGSRPFQWFFGMPIIAIQPRNPEFQFSAVETITIHFVKSGLQNTS